MNRQPFRAVAGGRIDRARPLTFRFDGRAYAGYEGDTLASALLANGVEVVGRSFRFHRPRGIMAAGVEEPCAIVQVGRGATMQPNMRATEVRLTDGLEARTVNAWPSARFDVAAVIGLASCVLSAGFYYKTFMWPSWRPFASLIRRAGGLGRAPSGPDPDLYAKTFATCDVLVIGAGPAGLAAALAAGRSGARVILVDAGVELGGSLLDGRSVIEGRPAMDWVAEAERDLAALPGVRILTRTTAQGWYDHNLLTLAQDCAPGTPRQRFWKVRAARVVLAAGAFERPLVFPGNDRPGVMLAGAARAYATRYGALAGRRALVVTNNDSGYEAAADLIDGGVEVVAIADLRPDPQGLNVNRMRERGVTVLAGHAPAATAGSPAIRHATLAPIDEQGRAGAGRVRIDCDLLAMAGGWNPAVHLFSQSGGRLRWDDANARFVPDQAAQAGEVVGAANGDMTLGGALRQGSAAGGRAARACGFEAEEAWAAQVVHASPRQPIRQLWDIPGVRGRAWVDFQNDVTVDDIRSAARENYASVEHLKRYTTLGMALDQGKTSNVNGLGVLSQALGAAVGGVGTTTFRPPFTPVVMGAIAGRRLGGAYHAPKQLPTHDRQVALGALMDDYGGWRRPAAYPRPGETEEAAIRREAATVRGAAGLLDASSLGKILVAGPDAAAFLERVYVNPVASLKVGRCRYGLMLNEQGSVMDDGVVTRLGPNRFLVGTTSGQAPVVAAWLEEWLQCEWPTLQVLVEPVSAQWATLNVSGPRSRDVLLALDPGLDLADERLPHMAMRETSLGGVRCQIARVSFTGERSYEVSAPADFGTPLWDALLEAGAPYGLAPFGVEALMRLRLEKGYLHVGADTETTSYPQDLGFGRAGKAKADDFIGRRSTTRAAPGLRRQLVGIETVDPAQGIPIGSHVIAGGSDRRSQGWVTSSGYSVALGRWVALALVEDGLSRLGEAVALYDRGALTAARLRPVCAYDPAGERLNA